MVSPDIISEPQVAEYEKLRKYVISQLAKSGSSPMRLASNRELAKQFGVSRPTVIKALKDLVDDGYLTVRKGIGVFTNPKQLHPTISSKSTKLMGLLVGDGKQTFLTRNYWQFGMFVEAIQKRSAHNLMRDCPLLSSWRDPDDVVKELESFGLDALVWLFPVATLLPAILKLKAAGMPVISFSIANEVHGISALSYGFEEDNHAVTSLMLDEGRRSPLLILSEDASSMPFGREALRGFRKAFDERAIPFDESSITLIKRNDSEGLLDAIDSRQPDALIFNTGIDPFWPMLCKRVDFAEKCRLYTSDLSIFDSMGYKGYIGEPDFRQYVPTAVENLEAQLASPANAPVINCKMRLKIKLVE